ncbi:MAG: hypothetical protein ACP5IE_06755 [Infirmifilum sp.]
MSEGDKEDRVNKLEQEVGELKQVIGKMYSILTALETQSKLQQQPSPTPPPAAPVQPQPVQQESGQGLMMLLLPLLQKMLGGGENKLADMIMQKTIESMFNQFDLQKQFMEGLMGAFAKSFGSNAGKSIVEKVIAVSEE